MASCQSLAARTKGQLRLANDLLVALDPPPNCRYVFGDNRSKEFKPASARVREHTADRDDVLDRAVGEDDNRPPRRADRKLPRPCRSEERRPPLEACYLQGRECPTAAAPLRQVAQGPAGEGAARSTMFRSPRKAPGPNPLDSKEGRPELLGSHPNPA